MKECGNQLAGMLHNVIKSSLKENTEETKKNHYSVAFW